MIDPTERVRTTHQSKAGWVVSLYVLVGLLSMLMTALVPATGASAIGWPVLARAIADLVLVAVALIGMTCLGSFAIRLLALPSLSPIVDVSISLVVGLGLWGGLLTAVGVFGFFGPRAVVLVTVVLFIPSVVVSASSPISRAWPEARSEIASILRGSWVGRIAMVVTVVVGLALLVIALGPVREWDTAMYHLSLPEEWIEAGRVFVPESNLHVAFTGAAHAIYGVFLAGNAVHGPAVLQVVLSLLTGLTVGSVLRSYFAPSAGAWGILLVWCSTAFVLVGSTALVDNLVVLVVLLSIAGLVSTLQGSHRAWQVVVVMLGAAGAVKYQALIYVSVVGGVLLLAVLIGKARVDLSTATALGTTGLAALLALPILARNLYLFGDPLYPFLRGPILSPWLADVAGDQTPVRGAIDYPVLAQARGTFNVKDWIYAPGRLTAEGTGHLQGFPVIYLAAFMAGWSSRGRRAVVSTIGPTAAAIGIILLAGPATNLRYLLPYVAAFSICAALGLGVLIQKFGPRGLAIASLLVGFGLAPVAHSLVDPIGSNGGLAVALGIESLEDWLDRPGNEQHRAVRAIGAILEETGAAQTILLFEGRGLHFPTPVLQDNGMHSWPQLLDAVEDSCLGQRYATHIVVNDRARDVLVANGARATRWAEWQDFEVRCLRYQLSVDGYSLYTTVDGD